MSGSVQLLKQEHDEVMAHLLATEPSLAVGLGTTLAKALALAGASEIEVDVQNHLLNYFEETTSSNSAAISFISNKAIKRQYHTYFDWDRPSANPFFGLFGDEFKKAMSARLIADHDLADSIRAFLDLGALRNQIIHKDFAAFPMSQSTDDIYKLYLSARKFCDEIPALLRTSPINGEPEKPGDT